MKKLKHAFLFLIVLSVTISCDKDEAATPAKSVFNPADYTEYLTCKVGDFTYATGNNSNFKTSVYAFKVSTTLYLTTSDGNFISGNIAPMEVNMQIKDFSTTTPKSYDVSGTYPTEILKFKYTDGDYDTNNGVNTTPQINKIIITKIENGYYSGTFAFTVYKVSNRATTLEVNQGSFKFKYPS